MTNNDIRKLYTRKVSELLAQGYEIHPNSMGGSQGEIAHIDLIKDNHILRVLIEEESSWGDGYGNTLTITVGRWNKPFRSHSTIWNSELEIIFQIKLAKISERFYTTLEEGKRMANIRWERYKAKRTAPAECSDTFKSIALRWLRRQPGMKTCKLGDITRMRRTQRYDGRIGYEITARGKDYSLHA